MILFIVISLFFGRFAAGDINDVLDIARANVHNHNKVVVCYWASWSFWREGDGSFSWEDLDPNLCTHLIYSFAGLDNATNTIKSLDSWLDLPDGKGFYSSFVGLKRKFPHLKVTIAIGGWNEGSAKYSNMAASPESRKVFIDSALGFVRKHGFDGLDLDWEYPTDREGSRPEDKENFVLLVKELRAAFGPNLLLTAALGVSPKVARKAYNLGVLSQYLDFLHLMCYDFHGTWDRISGHNAPLERVRDEDEGLSVLEVVNHFVTEGAERKKLVLGVPFYGRTFLLINDEITGISALNEPITGAFQGRFTKEDGFMGYNEICLEQKESPGMWKEVFDDEAKVPVLYSGNKWVSFDNEVSLRHKANFAVQRGLAGIMIWSIDTDDFKGRCGSIKFPLLRSINHALVYPSESGEDEKENEVDDDTIAGDKTSAISVSLFMVLFMSALVSGFF